MVQGHDIDWSKRLANYTGRDPGVGGWPDGEARGPWGPHWAPGSGIGRRLDVNLMTSNANMLEFLTRNEIDYLISSQNLAHVLALEAKRLGVEVTLDRIMLHGNAPTQAGRRACEEVFGARLMPLYSSKEGHRMAHTCPTGEHYHVHAENILVEIVDEEGRVCAPGQLGRVVITHSTQRPNRS
jgi:phenylacetate-CoA ligase